MAEQLKNKEAMAKLSEELTKEINLDSIKEPTLSHVPYLHACVLETLRLHPPIPLIPHRAMYTFRVLNYTIPKNTRIVGNVWAIGRDPTIWEDPLMFKPKRFLGSDKRFVGGQRQNFEFLPFGSGKRMCPGQNMSKKQVMLILAYLVHGCDWSLPNDEDLLEMNVKEMFDLTMHKEQPLCLIPRKKVKYITFEQCYCKCKRFTSKKSLYKQLSGKF